MSGTGRVRARGSSLAAAGVLTLLVTSALGGQAWGQEPPTVTVAPDSGPPGTTVTVAIDGNTLCRTLGVSTPPPIPGNGPVLIQWDGEEIASLTPSGEDDSSTSFTVPEEATPEAHEVVVRCQNHNTVLATRAFTVTPPDDATTEESAGDAGVEESQVDAGQPGTDQAPVPESGGNSSNVDGSTSDDIQSAGGSGDGSGGLLVLLALLVAAVLLVRRAVTRRAKRQGRLDRVRVEPGPVRGPELALDESTPGAATTGAVHIVPRPDAGAHQLEEV